jgi:hypothetical protein
MRILYPRVCLGVCAAIVAALWVVPCAALPSAPLGGFIPLVGIGMNDYFEDFDTDPTGSYFVADPSFDFTDGDPLGPGSATYFDIALLDTGAATHILTMNAASGTGFSIQAEGFRGTNFQDIFGANGVIQMRINDPLGIYMAGLRDATTTGATLAMDTLKLRGQTSTATLEGTAEWKLPNIIGLPMAAQHGITIRNSDPLIFQQSINGQMRTVRTPNVEMFVLGNGSLQGVQRRTNLRLRPSASFISGPLYVQGLGDIFGGGAANDPNSPTVVDSGGLYLDVDVIHHGETLNNAPFLFDTGADLTVMSTVFASSLGFDVLNDQPDFLLEVEGAGGVASGVPGFYLDQLKIDAVGGAIKLEHVPIAVLDVPNPSDPANIIDAIIGTHVFTARDLVIDAVPAASGQGAVPSLYISDPVTESHAWSTAAPSASWGASASWAADSAPAIKWDAQVVNSANPAQTAVVAANSTVYRMTVAGNAPSAMTVAIQTGATLTTFGEALIKAGGRINLQGGKLDAQFINIESEGVLSGNGQIFVGAGPVQGAVRNLAGRVAPNGNAGAIGTLAITGDIANLGDGVLAFDLSGTGLGAFDQVTATRFAFLGGTLEVALSSFTPAVGNTFTLITAAEGVSGHFENLILPGGFQWNVAYQAKAVVLSVTGIGSLPGDFNNTGSVNGGDLATWTNGYGPTYNGGDFLLWQRNFTGTGTAVGVPEPAAALMLASAVAAFASGRRKSI